MSDLIDRQAAIDAIERNACNTQRAIDAVIGLPSAQQVRTEMSSADDLISRQAAIEALDEIRHALWEIDIPSPTVPEYVEHHEQVQSVWKLLDKKQKELYVLPSAQPEITDEQAILHLQTSGWMQTHDKEMYEMGLREKLADDSDSYDALLPSAQPERTCVNCGRTANNGGWYADGRTRCPIEEHYALPKDGYCHLWEKRNVTDDDYPERREE